MSVIIFITGASRGFGRALSISFAREFESFGVSLVLLSRDVDGLATTAKLVTQAVSAASVETHAVDLANIDAFEHTWLAAVEKARQISGGRPFSRAILVHNAGSVDPIGLASDAHVADAPAVRASADLNIVGPWLLTSAFLRFCASHAVAAPRPGSGGGAPHAVVNVSSLAALQPMATMGFYCVGKAARDMMARVVAGEGAPHGVRALSYAPGPMDTDMTIGMRRDAALDPATAAFFAQLQATGAFVDPLVSAAACARLVAGGAYESGAHVDYYDIAAKPERG
jgi:sepiapterin reductase